MEVVNENQQSLCAVDTLLLNLDGYEGPIDVLLQLARDQKVDLTKISILQLARQYLEFVEIARSKNIDLAADYLVMAAWLAYLKSRLLLPKEDEEDNISAQEMAEALQFQLRRLEAMQEKAMLMDQRLQLGHDFYARGGVSEISTKTKTVFDVTLYDILKSYGSIKQRSEGKNYKMPSFNLMSMDYAMERLCKMLGSMPLKEGRGEWASIYKFLPEGLGDGLFRRSSLASTLTAGLELVKQGKAEIMQESLYQPIYIRVNNTAIDDYETNKETETEEDNEENE